MRYGYLYAVCIIISLFGCSKKEELFQAPERKSNKIEFPEQSLSTVTVSTVLPYTALKQLINENIPDVLSFDGAKNDCLCGNHPALGTNESCITVPYADFRGIGTRRQCIDIPAIVQKRACAGCSWRAAIKPRGSVDILYAGSAVRVSQPLDITGKAGVRGGLAKVFSLSGKSFEADLEPTFDLTLDINQDWCPIVTANILPNSVTSASVEAIGKSCISIDLGPLGHPKACVGPSKIDLTKEANDGIESNLSTLSDSIKSSISCDLIKTEISKNWQTVSIPITLPSSESLFLNATPISAAFGGFVPEENGIRLTFLARAQIVVEETPIEEIRVQLPKLERTLSRTSSIQINLPVQIPFVQIEKSLNNIFIGKVFSKKTEFGKSELRINSISVYPNYSSLVVGLYIDANIPGNIFNTTGWVYLSGIPTIGDGGTSMTFEDLTYATVLDNNFWSDISIIFDEQIINLLSDASKIDLAGTLNEYEEKVTQQFEGVIVPSIEVNNITSNISAKNVQVHDKGITITLELATSLEVDISQ